MGFQQLWRAGGGAGGKGGECRGKSWDGGLFGEGGRVSGGEVRPRCGGKHIGLAWWVVAGIHYSSCISYHYASKCVFVCAHACVRSAECTQTDSQLQALELPLSSVSVLPCTLGQSFLWETPRSYYSIQIQMGLSGKLLLFITCQKSQGMDGKERSKLKDTK